MKAFLFYPADFLAGTLSLPMEERGKYITLLCFMHAYGRLSADTITRLAGDISKNLQAKFNIDEQGLWYNKRLETEIKNREMFILSRRNNGNKGGRPGKANKQTCAAINDIPSPPEVKCRFMLCGLTEPEAALETNKFMAYYTRNGWKTNSGNPVSDWKTAVSNWLVHRNQFTILKQPKTLTQLWLE